MSNTYQEDHQLALKKTTHWQIYLLIAMGLFHASLVLLFIGEVSTRYYRSTSFFIFTGIMVALLAWTAYIWVNLWRTIRASRAYLKSSKEEDLIKAHQQQRLFWRNIALVVGLLMGLGVGVFMLVFITSGGRL